MSRFLASRVKLVVQLDDQGYPTADPRRIAKVEKLKLVSRSSSLEAWHSSLQEVLGEKAWSRAPPGERLSPERSQRSSQSLMSQRSLTASSVGGRSRGGGAEGSGSLPRVPSFHRRTSSGGSGSPPRVPSAQRLSGAGGGSPPRGLLLERRPSLTSQQQQQQQGSGQGNSPQRGVPPLERRLSGSGGGSQYGGLPSPPRLPSPQRVPSGYGLPRPQPSPPRMPSPQPLLVPGPQPDPLAVHELTGMGFPAHHAANALMATGNAGVNPALDWLLANAGSPLLEQPGAFSPKPAYATQRPAPLSPMPGGPSNWGAGPADASAADFSPLGASMAALQGGMGGGGSPYQSPAGYGSVQPGWVPGGAGADATLNPMLAGMSVGGAIASMEVYPQPGGQQGAQRQLSLGSVGVGGLLKREERRAAETENTMEQAFSDLSNLMGKAADMVELAERFRSHMNRRDGTGSASDAGSDAEELDAETALDLLSLGIVNPVTKESAGAQYQQQLARQLADFLKGPVEKLGGLMPLPDVYCLFNRARGAELVSPDDVLSAVKLFPTIGAPLQLREFGSGVKVVQAATHSDEQVCRQLAAMVAPTQQEQQATPQDHHTDSSSSNPSASNSSTDSSSRSDDAAGLGPGITSTDVAAAMAVPLAVASEHLLMAEAKEVLCRDDGPEGLRFFRNFFRNPWAH
ncbi:hypothetical protein N2152v2_007073 [Parachlorella kessleri]